jgi:ribosomal-protein-alanine N-acetyltransferase
MASSCRLRPATLADLAELVELEVGSFNDPWSEEQLRAALGWPGAVALVAENDTGLTGYVLGRVIVDQAEILSLATSALHRRRGIGGELLTTALAEMVGRGARSAWLEVRESNEAARALYAAAGFVAAGRRRDYYRQPVEDALVLHRTLLPGKRVNMA